MVDPHRLRMLHAVVRHGTVHRAAELLGYTPSTVSQHLAALQRETGLSLVERRGRGLAPTMAGLRLVEAASGVLDQMAEVSALVDDLREGRTGRLLLSYVASAGVALIPPVVAKLAEERPDVRLDLRLNELTVDPPFVPDLDLYVVQARAQVPSGDGYHHQVLFDDPFYVVVRADHPLAGRTQIRPLELAGEPLIDNDIGQGPCRQTVLDLFQSVGLPPVFRVEAHDYVAAIDFVAAGVGVSVIPRLGLRHLPDDVEAIPIVDPRPVRTLVLRTREGMLGHPVVERATELLLESVAAKGLDPEPIER